MKPVLLSPSSASVTAAGSLPSLEKADHSATIKKFVATKVQEVSSYVERALEIYSGYYQDQADPVLVENARKIIKALASDDLTIKASGILAGGRLAEEVKSAERSRFPEQMLAGSIACLVRDPNLVDFQKIVSLVPDSFLSRCTPDALASDVCLAFGMGVKAINPRMLGNINAQYDYMEQVEVALYSCPIRSLVQIGKINQVGMYEKSRIIEAIGKREGVEVASSDKGIVAQNIYYDSQTGGITFGTIHDLIEDFIQIGNVSTYLDQAESYLQKRVELLGQGAIYIKPFQGACSENVIRLELQGNKLTIQGDEQLIDFLAMARQPLNSAEGLQSLAREGKLKAIIAQKDSTAEHVDYELSIDGVAREHRRTISQSTGHADVTILMQGNSGQIVINPSMLTVDSGISSEDFENLLEEIIKQNNHIIMQYENGWKIVDPNEKVDHSQMGIHDFIFHPALYQDFFCDCQVSSSGKDSLTIELGRQADLLKIMAGVDYAYLASGICSYAEKGIEVPRFEDKTWEIRAINFNTPRGPIMRASYCKVAGSNEEGDANVVNNISRGGSGEHTEQLIRTIYQQLYPDQILNLDRDDFICEKVHDFMERLEGHAQAAVLASTEHFRSEALSKIAAIPEFYGGIDVDTCSTDFMIEVRQTEDGPKLFPVLIDFNLFYGFEGLKTADFFASYEVSSELRSLPRTKDLVLEHLS